MTTHTLEFGPDDQHLRYPTIARLAQITTDATTVGYQAPDLVSEAITCYHELHRVTAERDALAAALHKMVEHEWVCAQRSIGGPKCDSMAEIARSALAAASGKLASKMPQDWNTENYTVMDCIEYAKSCIKNKDSRDCTLLWLERALELLASKQ